MNDCQGKALREGCCEREWARTSVSSREKNNVKNGFSDTTKEQEGREWPRKDIMNRHQVKALREGCHERKEARMGVSSRAR